MWALEEAGLIRIESVRVYRNPLQAGGEEERKIAYTEEQEAAIRRFSQDYDRGLRRTYLG